MAEFLSGTPAAPCICCMDNVTLPPELKRFAIEAVANGRYRDLSKVLAAGLELRHQADAEVAAFVDSLEGARAEADHDGWCSLEEVMAEADQIIAAKRGGA
jgi:Arc/MetJ-type ribon-helix-helix transcriptional regulator